MPKFTEGEILDGTVVRIVDFGAFVQLPGEVDGLLHISKIADHRVERVSDYLEVDQKVKVKILEQNGRKISLGLEK
jgi:polyribonucleotide nucleotidyltransferase